MLKLSEEVKIKIEEVIAREVEILNHKDPGTETEMACRALQAISDLIKWTT